jgi:hypothetical protein
MKLGKVQKAIFITTSANLKLITIQPQKFIIRQYHSKILQCQSYFELCGYLNDEKTSNVAVFYWIFYLWTGALGQYYCNVSQ